EVALAVLELDAQLLNRAGIALDLLLPRGERLALDVDGGALLEILLLGVLPAPAEARGALGEFAALALDLLAALVPDDAIRFELALVFNELPVLLLDLLLALFQPLALLFELGHLRAELADFLLVLLPDVSRLRRGGGGIVRRGQRDEG